jgi:predicted transcriptional regulator
MRFTELLDRLNARVLSGNEHLDNDISQGIISDILSDVMVRGRKGSVWVTNHINVNVIAIAFFKGLSGVILPNDLELDQEASAKAIEKQIPVLSTSYSAFDVVGLLYEMGLRG